MLLQLSQFFPFCSPPPSTPTPSGNPHPIVHIRGSCLGFLATPFPILYFTTLWLFCNYLFVFLNPLTSSPIPLYHTQSGNHQNPLCIHDSVSVLLVCLVCFLDLLIVTYLLPFYCSYFDLFLK